MTIKMFSLALDD